MNIRGSHPVDRVLKGGRRHDPEIIELELARGRANHAAIARYMQVNEESKSDAKESYHRSGRRL